MRAELERRLNAQLRERGVIGLYGSVRYDQAVFIKHQYFCVGVAEFFAIRFNAHKGVFESTAPGIGNNDGIAR